MLADDICVCGHERKYHSMVPMWTDYCLFCIGSDDVKHSKHEFKLDNLRYLEKYHDKKD